MNEKQFYIYLMTNNSNNVIYTGVTSNLKKRVYQHKKKIIKGFTSKYKINKLVYYEIFKDAYTAISREKKIKGGSRKKKIELIENFNPNWDDLYEEI